MRDESIRAFIAIELPVTVQEAVWELQDRLQSHRAARDLRWVEPEDAHLTLKFLGETPIPRLPALVDALDRVTERWEPFDVTLGPLGAFPNVSAPHTLWLAASSPRKALIHLFNAVEVALKRESVPPERRPLHPHLTIARLPRHWSADKKRAVGDLVGAVTLPDVPPFTAAGLALMRSELTPEGAIYTRLAQAHFGSPPPLQQDDWEDEP